MALPGVLELGRRGTKMAKPGLQSDVAGPAANPVTQIADLVLYTLIDADSTGFERACGLRRGAPTCAHRTCFLGWRRRRPNFPNPEYTVRQTLSIPACVAHKPAPTQRSDPSSPSFPRRPSPRTPPSRTLPQHILRGPKELRISTSTRWRTMSSASTSWRVP